MASANVTFFCCNRRWRVGSSLIPIIILSRISESSRCSKAQDCQFPEVRGEILDCFAGLLDTLMKNVPFGASSFIVDFAEPVFIECFLDLHDLVPIGVVVDLERSEDRVRC